jgi:hypothetical protein
MGVGVAHGHAPQTLQLSARLSSVANATVLYRVCLFIG